MKTSKPNPLLGLPLAIVSGVMLAFALPPWGIGALGWVAFLPLLLAGRMSRPVVAAGYGLLATLTCAVILSGRLSEASQFGNVFATFGTLGLVLAFSGLFGSVSARLNPVFGPLFVACAGVTAELASIWVFPVNVAISQYQNPAMLKVTSYTGIWGVSFLIWFVPAAVIAMFRKPKAAWPALAVALIAVAAGGIVRFPIAQQGRVLRVAAIQTPYAYEARRLTHDIADKVSLVVWPEQRLNPADGNPSRAARDNRVYVVADIIESRGKAKPYNTAYLFSPSGQVIGKQTKRFPFGIENRICSRGTESRPIDRGGFCAGMAVCFDTQFTVVARDLVRRGADIVLVPVHDPEMPSSLLNYLHGAIIPFRAAENGVPIVWADSKGLSAIVDGSGRIITRAPVRSVGAVFAAVRLGHSTTLASVYGDYFAYACAAGFAIGLIALIRRRGVR